jgi:hypothetical protein
MRNVVLLILSVALSTTVNSIAQEKLAERSAGALAANYETVVGSDGPLITKKELNTATQETQATILNRPFGLLTAALATTDKSRLERFAEGNTKVLAGVNDFRPPQGFGMIVAHYCYVLIYDNSHVPDWDNLFAGFSKESAEGRSWWKWSAKLNEFGEEDSRESTFFAIKGAGLYLLITNSRSQLETLSAIDAQIKSGLVRVPADGDLKALLAHRMWGLRNLRLTEKDSHDVVPPCIVSNFNQIMFDTDFTGNSYRVRVIDKADNADYPPCFTKSPSTHPFVHSAKKNTWTLENAFVNDRNDSMLRSIFVLLGFGGAY